MNTNDELCFKKLLDTYYDCRLFDYLYEWDFVRRKFNKERLKDAYDDLVDFIDRYKDSPEE